MKTMSITLEDELFEKIKRHIPPRKISKFISLAIKDKIDEQENNLYEAYKTAENDSDRQQELKEWESIDGIEWQ